MDSPGMVCRPSRRSTVGERIMAPARSVATVSQRENSRPITAPERPPTISRVANAAAGGTTSMQKPVHGSFVATAIAPAPTKTPPPMAAPNNQREPVLRSSRSTLSHATALNRVGLDNRPMLSCPSVTTLPTTLSSPIVMRTRSPTFWAVAITGPKPGVGATSASARASVRPFTACLLHPGSWRSGDAAQSGRARGSLNRLASSLLEERGLANSRKAKIAQRRRD